MKRRLPYVCAAVGLAMIVGTVAHGVLGGTRAAEAASHPAQLKPGAAGAPVTSTVWTYPAYAAPVPSCSPGEVRACEAGSYCGYGQQACALDGLSWGPCVEIRSHYPLLME